MGWEDGWRFGNEWFEEVTFVQRSEGGDGLAVFKGQGMGDKGVQKGYFLAEGIACVKILKREKEKL